MAILWFLSGYLPVSISKELGKAEDCLKMGIVGELQGHFAGIPERKSECESRRKNCDCAFLI
jgi:hypothetical protein